MIIRKIKKENDGVARTVFDVLFGADRDIASAVGDAAGRGYQLARKLPDLCRRARDTKGERLLRGYLSSFIPRDKSNTSFDAPPTTERTHDKPYSNKLVGLELIRFVAGISVLIWHYQLFSFVGLEKVNFEVTKQPFYDVFKGFYSRGFWAVQIFWSVSGFIFFWKYRTPISERAVNLGNFFILRLSRLYPLHFVTLLGVAGLQYLYWKQQRAYFYLPANTITDFLLQIFLVANRGLTQDSFNYPIWSVSVEMWIYLLFFLTVRYISRSWLVNALVVGACIWAGYGGKANPLIECAKLFYLGGLAAILRRRLTSPHVAVAATCCAWIVAFFLTRWIWINYGAQTHTFMGIFSCTAVPVFLFCLSHIPRLPRGVEKCIEAAGNVTYSSYLIHFPIQILIALVCSYQGRAVPLYDPVFFIGYMSVALICAHFVYKYFELPAQKTFRRVKIVIEG